MRSRPLIVVSLAIICPLAVIAVVALSRLPAGFQLPVHWNAAEEADRFADAGYALFMPVVLSAGLSALFAVLPRIEPLQDRMSGSAALLDACWTGLLALMLLVQLTVAAPAFGLVLPSTVILAGLGVLLIAIGNALPKSRPGFFVGIRTPWALIDTDNWIATHRLGSRTTMAAGAIIVAIAVLPIGAQARGAAVCLALAVMVVPPVVYSWWLWRRNSAQA